jgi:hypothetical protein
MILAIVLMAGGLVALRWILSTLVEIVRVLTATDAPDSQEPHDSAKPTRTGKTKSSTKPKAIKKAGSISDRPPPDSPRPALAAAGAGRVEDRAGPAASTRPGHTSSRTRPR